MAQNRDSVSVANDPGDGDLHARLLAEIERREGEARHNVSIASIDGWDWYLEASLAYLAALKAIVELHRLVDGDTYRDTPCCARCTAGGEYPADDEYSDERNWPCPTLAAVAEGLGVEVE